MLKHVAVAFAVIALSATSAAAQGRGNGKGKGKVPPGHMPPAGLCKVWYEGVPPGRQPRANMNCGEAERIAARDGARVIYGDGRNDRNQGSGGGGVWDRNGDGRVDRDRNGDGRIDTGRTDRRRPTGDASEPRGRAIPRTGGSTTQFGGRLNSLAADAGYRDGLLKGREDLEDGDSFDPNRHSWYRSADRGYTSRDGSKDTYRDEYRRGFLRGYDAGYARSRGRS